MESSSVIIITKALVSLSKEWCHIEDSRLPLLLVCQALKSDCYLCC